MFVFDEQGLPLADIEVRSDERLLGTTNRNGALFFSLAPEGHELHLLRGGEEFLNLPLSLVPGENAQIIVNVDGESRTNVAIESSNKATEGAGQVAEAEAAAQAEGDPGTLAGRIYSSETGNAVEGARVFVSGTPLDLRTDEEGRFEAQLPPGSYSISILHGDHATQTVDGIEVASNEATPLEVELVPAGLELPEFVVLEPYVEGSLASVMEEQRTTSAVVNVLGAEAISRAGDSDAAGALKRVTGLTLVGGQFIYVRGLGERYSTTSLNGASVPSPDPTRRVVPLDLFPADIIASVVVSKSYSAELPAGFGGGDVTIRTKSIPESPFLAFNSAIGWDSQTTFKDGLHYRGGNSDWRGYDDGSRALPGDLRDALESGRPIQESNLFAPDGFTAEELEAFGESLPNIYTVSEGDIGVDRSIGISGGYRWDWDNGVTLGFLAALNYGDEWDNRTEERRSFRLSTFNESGLEVFNDFVVDVTERVVDVSGFLTLGARFKEDHELDFTTTWLRLSEDETAIREGFLRDFGDDVRFTSLIWEERELLSNQIRGKHTLPGLGDLEIDWIYDQSEAIREAPDQRFIRQDYDRDRDEFGLSLRPDAIGRIYDDLVEETENHGVSVALPWEPADWVRFRVEAGVNEFDRNRESQIFRLSFRDRGPLVGIDELFLPLEALLAPEFIDPRGWVIENRTLATDNYVALQDIEAKYLALDTTLFDDFRLYLGARDEISSQTAITFNPFAAELEPIVAELETDDRYPAAVLTWQYSESSQIRFDYAESVSRPDLRELSPAPFRDPVLDLIVIGEPDLVATGIQHMGVRWEMYLSPAESISAAVFRKEFTSPIERIISTGAAQIGTFANALAAENQGVEIDFYKELGFLWDRLEPFYLAGNFAYIESTITLDPLAAGNLTSQERPLQGQSDIVANLQLGYDNPDRGTRATLLFNHTGERISDVGTQGIPDVIEQPYNQLDFVLSQQAWDGWEFKLKLQNLLDDEVEFKQSTETRRVYKRGREVGLSVEFSFD
ncbi:MAG: TonB-dependent receptor [Xanthomonadales bacterium]|nr:TonB-dependent receptor [Xanthomonadales bacterium]